MHTPHVTHFLDFLAHKKGAHKQALNTFCWMDGKTAEVVRGRGTVHGKFKSIVKWEQELAREKVKLPTLHVTLNETNLNGRRTEHIKGYRVLCCDIDEEIPDYVIIDLYKTYQVQMVVRSSKGKYHLYWQLERGADMEVWRKLQLGIASKLGGDLEVSKPTSMIRVPGFARIAKDGKQQLCSVMTFEQDNPVKPLSVKEIVKRWPWIWEESEKGEQTLAKARREAGRIARQMLRARGTEYDSAKFARMTPGVGRNTTLYLAVGEVVKTHEEKLSFEDTLTYGREVNEAFDSPLGEIEMEKTVRSAWKSALKIRAKGLKERRELVSALETTRGDVASSSREKPGKFKRKDKKAQRNAVSSIITESILGPEVIVPDSFLAVSDIIIGKVWDSEVQLLTQNTLVSAKKTKYYKRLCDHLLVSLKHTGSFRVAGYSAYLRGSNAEGGAVRYRKFVDRDSMAALAQDLLSRLFLSVVQRSLNGKGDSRDAGEATGSKFINYLEKESVNGNSGKAKTKKEEKKKNDRRSKAASN